MNVKTRIAPSPTGRFHIGTARTALINFLFARSVGGAFAIRIEDTDKERSRAEFETEILEGLAWMGLSADEIVRQSERAPRHTELLSKLIAEGKAYISEEASKQDPDTKVALVRLRNPGQQITFHDEVRGDITFDTTELGDFVLARSLTDPLYHFAVVADDSDMSITHVIRGEDHISNTPRQILIQEALGVPRPIYAHLPLILDAKRAKLSKRNGVTSVMDYRAEGILPEALINYLALLGWSPGNDTEDFSLEELTSAFTLSGVQKSGAIWDKDKLLSVNQRWMRKLSDQDYAHAVGGLEGFDEATLTKTLPLLRERTHTFLEAREMLSGELRGLFEEPSIHKDTLLAKEPETTPGLTKEALAGLLRLLETLPSELESKAAETAIMPFADDFQPSEEGEGTRTPNERPHPYRGAVLWPLRYALSGEERSPDPFTLIAIVGRDVAIRRIAHALAILE